MRKKKGGDACTWSVTRDFGRATAVAVEEEEEEEEEDDDDDGMWPA